MTTTTPRAFSAPDAIANSLAVLFMATSAAANTSYAVFTYTEPNAQAAIAVTGVIAAYVATFIDFNRRQSPNYNIVVAALRVPALMWGVTCAGFVVQRIWFPGIGPIWATPLVLAMNLGGCTALYWATNRVRV